MYIPAAATVQAAPPTAVLPAAPQRAAVSVPTAAAKVTDRSRTGMRHPAHSLPTTIREVTRVTFAEVRPTTIIIDARHANAIDTYDKVPLPSRRGMTRELVYR